MGSSEQGESLGRPHLLVMRDNQFRLAQQSESTLYKDLWPDCKLQDFKDEMLDHIQDNKLMVGGQSVMRHMLDNSSTALHKLVELHYEIKHMRHVERRQVEEIDRFREKFKDSENKLHHLGQINEALELTIVELKKELGDSKRESAGRLNDMNNRAQMLKNADAVLQAEIRGYDEKLKKAFEDRDQQLEATKALLAKTKEENRIFIAKVQGSERAAKVLKEVITNCAESLQKATE